MVPDRENHHALGQEDFSTVGISYVRDKFCYVSFTSTDEAIVIYYIWLPKLDYLQTRQHCAKLQTPTGSFWHLYFIGSRFLEIPLRMLMT